MHDDLVAATLAAAIINAEGRRIFLCDGEDDAAAHAVNIYAACKAALARLPARAVPGQGRRAADSLMQVAREVEAEAVGWTTSRAS